MTGASTVSIAPCARIARDGHDLVSTLPPSVWARSRSSSAHGIRATTIANDLGRPGGPAELRDEIGAAACRWTGW